MISMPIHSKAIQQAEQTYIDAPATIDSSNQPGIQAMAPYGTTNQTASAMTIVGNSILPCSRKSEAPASIADTLHLSHRITFRS